MKPKKKTTKKSGHTNHFKTAIKMLERVTNMETSVDLLPVAGALVAQTHATLALVEQQRIANLIALTLGANDQVSVSKQIMDDAYSALADTNDELHPHIKTILGVKQCNDEFLKAMKQREEMGL